MCYVKNVLQIFLIHQIIYSTYKVTYDVYKLFKNNHEATGTKTPC